MTRLAIVLIGGLSFSIFGQVGDMGRAVVVDVRLRTLQREWSMGACLPSCFREFPEGVSKPQKILKRKQGKLEQSSTGFIMLGFDLL